ncbi:hypothetical protein OSTOST_06214 [Ostertagia ostertagi]
MKVSYASTAKDLIPQEEQRLKLETKEPGKPVKYLWQHGWVSGDGGLEFGISVVVRVVDMSCSEGAKKSISLPVREASSLKNMEQCSSSPDLDHIMDDPAVIIIIVRSNVLVARVFLSLASSLCLIPQLALPIVVAQILTTD